MALIAVVATESCHSTLNFEDNYVTVSSDLLFSHKPSKALGRRDIMKNVKTNKKEYLIAIFLTTISQ